MAIGLEPRGVSPRFRGVARGLTLRGSNRSPTSNCVNRIGWTESAQDASIGEAGHVMSGRHSVVEDPDSRVSGSNDCSWRGRSERRGERRLPSGPRVIPGASCRCPCPVPGLLKATALFLEAIAHFLEATAHLLEAIAHFLEAIALLLEGVAHFLEAPRRQARSGRRQASGMDSPVERRSSRSAGCPSESDRSGSSGRLRRRRPVVTQSLWNDGQPEALRAPGLPILLFVGQ